MWHTRINSTVVEEDFIALTKFNNDTNTREWNRKRALILGFEQDVRIAPGANVRLGSHGKLGTNVFIGIDSYINGDVIIENDVLIGPFCSLTSNSHLFNTETLNFRGLNSNRPIIIGQGSWLSTGVVINPGVVIGKGNLILPNSVVTKNTSDYIIMGGNPAKKCGSINVHNGSLIWDESMADEVKKYNKEEIEKKIFFDRQQESKSSHIGHLKEEKEQEIEKKSYNELLDSNYQLEMKVKLLESKIDEMNKTMNEMNSTLQRVMNELPQLRIENQSQNQHQQNQHQQNQQNQHQHQDISNQKEKLENLMKNAKMILKGLDLQEDEMNDFLNTLQHEDYDKGLIMLSDFSQQVIARRELEQDLY